MPAAPAATPRRTTPSGRRGRPPGPAAGTREVVLTAALDLLLTEGVAALTVARLHEASGVARTTIYRHWPTPDAVVDDLLDVAERTAHPQPTGDLERDLGTAVDALLWRLRHRPVAPFLAALMWGPPGDAVGLARRARYVEALLGGLTAAVRAARPPVPSARRDDVVQLVGGPLLLRWLATGRVPTRARVRPALDAAVAHARA